MNERRGVIFGGSGRLGREFVSLVPSCFAPSHGEVDIAQGRIVSEYLHDLLPSWVVHTAAIVGRREAEVDKDFTYLVNVGGTENVARACRDVKAKLVFISSVAVFDGQKGMYVEDDIPLPSYYYGWTKLIGEHIVKMLSDYVIARTDFFVPGSFKYQRIFTDHYCSKLPVGKVAAFLERIVNSDFNGIINVGGERDTLFNILKPYVSDIVGITIGESEFPDFPRDLSLDNRLRKRLF